MAASQFWMVQGAGHASHRHNSRQSAEIEAARLAARHPDHTFFVMEAIAAHRAVTTKRVDLRSGLETDAEVPF